MRDFLFYIQHKRSLNDLTVNMIISYLQFFQIYVLHKDWNRSQIPFRKINVYLPFVPSRKQVALFILSLEDQKVRLAVSMLYSTGLQIDELCHLRCQDIIHSSHKLHVVHSKNRQDRYVPLPETIWQMILDYWYSFPLELRPRVWLFTQQHSLISPMDHQWLQRQILTLKKRLAMAGRLSSHSFRHAYATHSYENGMDLLTLKAFLGHKSLNSTLIYVHLATTENCKIINPFDQLRGTDFDRQNNHFYRQE